MGLIHFFWIRHTIRQQRCEQINFLIEIHFANLQTTVHDYRLFVKLQKWHCWIALIEYIISNTKSKERRCVYVVLQTENGLTLQSVVGNKNLHLNCKLNKLTTKTLSKITYSMVGLMALCKRNPTVKTNQLIYLFRTNKIGQNRQAVKQLLTYREIMNVTSPDSPDQRDHSQRREQRTTSLLCRASKWWNATTIRSLDKHQSL